MEYDPIKRSLGRIFNASPFLRILFYRLLDLLLLRTWHVKKELRKWIKAYRIPGIRRWILDAGAGFGQYTYFLSGLIKDDYLIAMDVKEEQVADCNAFFTRIGRSQVLFEKADLITFKRPDKFDLILCVDVMEHIPEDEQVFRNFYDSLTQGGMVLISTPSDQGGSDVHDHGAEDSFIGEHVRDGYNIGEIRKKLERAGFYKTDARYTYGKPGQLGWKISMKWPILMLNTSRVFFVLLPFYYLIAEPFTLILNFLDLRLHHASGTGLIVRAWK